MADTKHEVKVDIIADSKKFRDELKNTAGAVKGFEKQGQVLRKEGVKGDREFKRASKEIRKMQRDQGKDALQAEKNILKQIDQKSKAMGKARREGKLDSQQRKAAVKELHELGKAHSRIHEQRKKMMGLTRRERLSAAMGRARQGIVSGVGAGILGLGAFAAGAIGGRIGSAQQVGSQVRTAEAGLIGSGTRRGQLDRAYGRGARLGFGPQASAEQAVALARGTGMGGRELGRAITTSQRAARVGMMDQGQTAAFMGVQARAGVTGRRGEKDLEKTFSNAFASGLKRGRFGEFFQGVTGLVQRAQAFTAGDVGAGMVSSRMGVLGLGGASGLQGGRGAQVAQRLDQAIRQPGGGEAGQALVLRGLGFGRPGGGGVGYTEAIRRQQRGFLGEGGVQNLKDVFGQLEQETGGGEEFSLAASRITGLTMDQVDEVKKSIDKLRSDGASEAEIQKELKNVTKEMKPLQDQANEVIKDVLAVEVKHQSKIQNQLFRESQGVHGSLKRMQEVSEEVFASIWPRVVDLLEIIANVVEHIWQGLQSLPGFDTQKRAKEQERAVRTGHKVDRVMSDFQQGKISKAEADKQLFEVIKEAEQQKKQIKDDAGILGFDPLGTAEGDAAFIQADQTMRRAMNKRALLGSMESAMRPADDIEAAKTQATVANDNQQEVARATQQESRNVSKAASDQARVASKRSVPQEVVVKNPEELADANAKKAAQGGIPMPNPGKAGGQSTFDGDQNL